MSSSPSATLDEPSDCCHVDKKCIKDKATCLAYGCQIYGDNELSAAYGRIRELEAQLSETRRSETRIAEDAIALFLEYRDKHGHNEKSAKASAINEFAEAGL